MTHCWAAPPQSGRSRDAVGYGFAILIPVWLLGLIFPPLVGEEPDKVSQIISLFWILPPALLVGRERFLIGPALLDAPLVRFCLLLFLAIAAISTVLSSEPLTSLGYYFSTAFGLLACAGLWPCLKGRAEAFLTVYASLGTILLGYFLLFGERFNGRLSWNAASPPNHMALVAFSIIVASTGISRRLVAIVPVAINLAVIVATQGRGLLLASLITIGAHGFLMHTRHLRRSGALLVLTVVFLVVMAALIYTDEIEGAIVDLLLLDDPYRGLGTGFTGRMESWREALEIFSNNPFFGVGFRTHELYMTTLSSAHNGYLAVLAESGAFGLASALLLVLVALLRCGRLAMQGRRLAIIAFSATLGYLFLAVFERYFINMGNPTSMLVWMLLLAPDSAFQERSAIAGGALDGTAHSSLEWDAAGLWEEAPPA